MSRPVYFVGTIGLDTADDVFKRVGRALGAHVRQVPDGEVAGRRQWVTYQLPVLRSYGFLKPQPPNRFVPLQLSDGTAPPTSASRSWATPGKRGRAMSISWRRATGS